MLKPTEKQLRAVMAAKGYKVFDGMCVPNIIGIRSAFPVDNHFNDCIVVFFKTKTGQRFIDYYSATTTPGQTWLKSPMHGKGTAIMCEGQYIDVYAVGKHRGYTALEQIAPIDFCRDNNKDIVIDYNSPLRIREVIKANIHQANSQETSTQVDGWSAGCQVINKGFTRFITNIILCRAYCNNKFSYTLLNETDFTPNA